MCLHHHTAAAFDPDRAHGFAERLLTTLNEGALCLMLSIGHRTGLFNAMADRGPLTSEQIAAAANLDERYVREWLGAMTAGRVVEYDPADRTYLLPSEHAAFLTHAPDNIAVFAQYIPLLGQVEDEIIHCFRNGGGVPYERYPRFHEVMAEDSGQTVLASLQDHILPLAAGLKERLQQGIRVLDVGCGRGRALLQLAQAYPQSEFTGVDLSREAVDYARAEAQRLGLDNAHFEVRDVSDFEHSAAREQFDLITTFDAVHDQARPMSVLKGIHKALKPDGVYLMQDIHGSSELHNNLDNPVATLLYTISTMHCMTVSLAQGGDGLGTMWGRETAEAYLRQAGFDSVHVHQLEHDFQNDYYIVRKH